MTTRKLSVSVCWLTTICILVWRIYSLEAERDELAAAHATFVTYCRNTVAVLAEQARPARCQPGFKAAKIGVNSSELVCVEKCAWCDAVWAKIGGN